MRRNVRRALLTGCLLLTVAGIASAQSGEMQRGPFSPTVFGSTGLITIFTADTMKQGEFAITVGHHNFDRDPGDVDINVNPVSLTIGFWDRIEFFVTANFNQSVDSDGKRLAAPQTRPRVPPPYNYRFNPDFPFQDSRSFGNGMGDILTGLKVNLLSELRGNPLGLALRGFVKIPTVRNIEERRRGRGTGEVDGGFDLIFSKNVRQVGTHYNVGVTFVGDPGANGRDVIDLRDKLRLGFGLNVPVTGNLQGIFEVNNTTFIGGGTPIAGPVNPVDVFGGLRYFPRDWFYFGGGYRYFINSTDTNPAENTFSNSHSGYTVQLSFMHRNNSVPVLQCAAESSSVLEGVSTQLSAGGFDADYNSTLDYRWTVEGGRIEGEGKRVTFHSDGLAPGIYRATVTLTDNRGGVATCSTEIEVLKRNLPPVVELQPKTASIGLGESVRIRAIASDPNNDAIAYEWTIAGERVASTGEEVIFGSTGRSLGEYQVGVRVSDGELAATDTAVVTVTRGENRPPSVSCSIERDEVMAGERVRITARGSDPDNDSLSYQWATVGGRIEGTGARVTLDTSGLSAGTYIINVSVSDGKGGTASGTCSVHVRERIRIFIDKLKLDNVDKATLDDVALKLQSDPRIQAVITGYGDSTGSARANRRVGTLRAEAVKKYLVDKQGIDPSRLETRSGGSSNPVAPNDTPEGRRQNRRAEVELYIP